MAKLVAEPGPCDARAVWRGWGFRSTLKLASADSRTLLVTGQARASLRGRFARLGARRRPLHAPPRPLPAGTEAPRKQPDVWLSQDRSSTGGDGSKVSEGAVARVSSPGHAHTSITAPTNTLRGPRVASPCSPGGQDSQLLPGCLRTTDPPLLPLMKAQDAREEDLVNGKAENSPPLPTDRRWGPACGFRPNTAQRGPVGWCRRPGRSVLAPLSSQAACPQPPQDRTSFLSLSWEQTPPRCVQSTSEIPLGSVLAPGRGLRSGPPAPGLGRHHCSSGTDNASPASRGSARDTRTNLQATRKPGFYTESQLQGPQGPVP